MFFFHAISLTDRSLLCIFAVTASRNFCGNSLYPRNHIVCIAGSGKNIRSNKFTRGIDVTIFILFAINYGERIMIIINTPVGWCKYDFSAIVNHSVFASFHIPGKTFLGKAGGDKIVFCVKDYFSCAICISEFT